MIKLRTALATAAAFGVIATSGLTFAQGFPGGGMGSMGGFGGLAGALGGLSGEGYAHGFGGGGSTQGSSWHDRDGRGMRARGGSVTGTVASVSGSQSITLSEPDQATATLPLAANVTVRAPGQSSASLTDVVAGDSVVLRLNGNAEVTSIFVPANQGSTAPTPSGVATVAVSPDPIAATGSLSAGQSVTVAVYAENANGQAVPGGSVDLSFAAATDGGSATADGTALTATPTAFTTGSDGTIAVTYTAPATLPASGTDVLTAANAATNPTATATDSYTFGSATTQSVSGSVVSLSNTNTITVVSDGQTLSYPLAANVSVTGANGQATTLASLNFGQNVTLTLSQGSVTAISVVS